MKKIICIFLLICFSIKDVQALKLNDIVDVLTSFGLITCGIYQLKEASYLKQNINQNEIYLNNSYSRVQTYNEVTESNHISINEIQNNIMNYEIQYGKLCALESTYFFNLSKNFDIDFFSLYEDTVKQRESVEAQMIVSHIRLNGYVKDILSKAKLLNEESKYIGQVSENLKNLKKDIRMRETFGIISIIYGGYSFVKTIVKLNKQQKKKKIKLSVLPNKMILNYVF